MCIFIGPFHLFTNEIQKAKKKISNWKSNDLSTRDGGVTDSDGTMELVLCCHGYPVKT